MNPKYRKTVIAGNWKMNLLPSDVPAYAARLLELLGGEQPCEIAICAPSVLLPAAVTAFLGSPVSVGAQDVSAQESGAFTGEISAAQLKDAGAVCTIVGHSERRAMHGETDALIAQKLRRALAAGLRPILCVGETLQQREIGAETDTIRLQLKGALSGLEPAALRRVILAYEPVWAIGTGRTATPEQASDMCGAIRTEIRKMFGSPAARAISVLYGGSMNAGNAAELLSCPDVDGGLIGGASLKPDSFYQIVKAVQQ